MCYFESNGLGRLVGWLGCCCCFFSSFSFISTMLRILVHYVWRHCALPIYWRVRRELHKRNINSKQFQRAGRQCIWFGSGNYNFSHKFYWIITLNYILQALAFSFVVKPTCRNECWNEWVGARGGWRLERYTVYRGVGLEVASPFENRYCITISKLT